MLRRILLFIGVTLIVMLFFITLATDSVIMKGFSHVERNFMMRNLARAENAISDQVSSMGRSAADWAAWDDAYRFVQDRNKSFVDANLGKDVFEDLHVDIVLFLDTDGAPALWRDVRPREGGQSGRSFGPEQLAGGAPFHDPAERNNFTGGRDHPTSLRPAHGRLPAHHDLAS